MNWTPPTPEDVRALREKCNLTQEQFAKLASVTPRHIQRYEELRQTSISRHRSRPP